MKHFLKEAYSLLQWTINYDDATIVLKTLYDLFKGSNNNSINKLKNDLEKRLSSIYGVIFEEVLFLLDLELCVNFFNREYLTIYSSNTVNGVINGNYMMCAIQNRHIIALNLSNWGLSKLPESIGSLSKLKYLILKKNNIYTLPKSIGLLRHLRTLDLSDCKITSLPNSLANLQMLKRLSLCRNYDLIEIPKPIDVMIKKNFFRKYVWEGVDPSEAYVLGLLEILIGSRLKKLKMGKFIIYRENACHYKTDNGGNIIGIYIFHSQLSKLTIIPEQICKLRFLQELELPNNEIRFIPKSIRKLIWLRRLNLRNNMIEEIPDSLNQLNNLNCLKLAGNRIEKAPEWIKNKLDKFESKEDLNGFKRYFFGIPIAEIIRKFPEKDDLDNKFLKI